MANVTHHSANLIANRLFGASTLTPPASYYLGVSTSTVNKNGSGISEPTSDISYARVKIDNNKTNFSNAVNGVISNNVSFSFPESSMSWGMVTDWFISDATTGGNIWYAGKLTLPRNVETETVLVLPIGALEVTVE